MSKLIIIGAGGHGRVVGDCAEVLGNYQQIEFLDDCVNAEQPNLKTAHWHVVGDIASWHNYKDSADFIVAIGNNELRLNIIEQLLSAGAKVVSLIHPSAVISKHTEIGVGTVVFAGAVINIGAKIGQGCIINTSANIDHDCNIANGVHISPNVSLAGGVEVGAETWIGIGATVIQYLSITRHCQIGAGSVVVKNITESGTYIGCPAQRMC